MILYIVLVLFIPLVYCAANRQSQEVGCLLSKSQTKAGFYIVNNLSGKKHRYKTKCNIIAFVVLGLMWFLTAFRASNIGNDTLNYINAFEQINASGISSQFRMEYGFQLLCLFIGLFTKNAQVFLVVCASICYIGVGVYIFRYSKNIIASVILLFAFCFSIFTNILRQDIAMVICLYAYQFIKEKKNMWAVLLILLAMTFHITAAICFLIFILKYLRHNFKLNIIVTILIIAASASGVLNSIMLKSGWFSNYAQGQYARTGWLAVTYGVLQSLFFYLFILNSYKRSKCKQTIIANCLAYLFISCFGFAINLFTRAAQYFMLPMMIEIPNACYDGNVKSRGFLLFIICTILLSYFCISLIFRPEWNNLYPYKFFWD